MKLEELSPNHERAFLEMISDFRSHDPDTLLKIIPETKGLDSDPEKAGKWFAKFIKETEKKRMDWRPGPGKVSSTSYVLIDSRNKIFGYGLMRFPLTSEIENEGGNLIFTVPPLLRRQGWGPVVLNRMLFAAARAGLARVMVACRPDNLAARKCIEKNRGETFEDAKDLVKFWIRFR